jgi:hypothetical protein
MGNVSVLATLPSSFIMTDISVQVLAEQIIGQFVNAIKPACEPFLYMDISST